MDKQSRRARSGDKDAAVAAAVLERVGIAGKGERGNFYDRFKGRVLFPIFNTQGKPIALGGRVLPHLADEAEKNGGRRPAPPVFRGEPGSR